jgi:hypothetical protein
MGSRGMYLNSWTPDFSPENDIPNAVHVWVRLPFLPLHCWNDETILSIGNTLGKYIDRVEPKDGLQACAWICVEVDLEKGLPEAINLTLDKWTYLQQVDYEQLPFKCKICHEYGHFAKHCPKSPPETPPEESDQWQQPKRKKQQRHGQNPKVTPTPPLPESSQDPEPSSLNPPENQDPPRVEPPPSQPHLTPPPASPASHPSMPPLHSSPSAPPSPHNPTSYPEDEEIDQSSEDGSDSDTHDSPIRKVGRKSNLHRREASARKEIELGKQTTLDQHTKKETRQTRNQNGSNPQKGGNSKPSK